MTKLDRPEWLDEHGFELDPFPFQAIRVEVDPLFESSQFRAYVDPPNYEHIRDENHSIIFGLSGSGKSSLRRRILHDFNHKFVTGSRKVLVVEYINHDEYSVHEKGIESHAARIAEHIKEEFGKRRIEFDEPFIPGTLLRDWLARVAKGCRKVGHEKILILVDFTTYKANDFGEAFDRIHSLITTQRLYNQKIVVFKFFLPKEISKKILTEPLLGSIQNMDINWDKTMLGNVLRKRLMACSSGSAITKIDGVFEELFAASQFTVEDMVNFGERLGHPRAMWQLGYYIIDRHFDTASGRIRQSNELIGQETIQWAVVKVEEDIQRQSEQWKQINVKSGQNPQESRLSNAVKSYYHEEDPKPLFDFLDDFLNENELKQVVFYLKGVDYEELAGATKKEKIRELLLLLKRQNRISDIIEAAKKIRTW
jgi:hypothetical protein